MKPTQSFAPKWISQHLLLWELINSLRVGSWLHENISSDVLASAPLHICSAPETIQLIDSDKRDKI